MIVLRWGPGVNPKLLLSQNNRCNHTHSLLSKSLTMPPPLSSILNFRDVGVTINEFTGAQ